MKRFLVVATAAVLGFSAFAPSANAQDDVFQIGLVTDVGQVDDRSFNQSAWEGAQAAAEAVGGVAEFIETTDPADYATNIQLFAEQGYDVIITVGFALGAATNEAAAQYPDIHFIGVDQFQGETIDNVTGLIFPEAQAGFLAGVLAGRLTQTGTIAAVLGTDQVPPVVAFKEGYEAGARYANPDITIISTYHPGGLDRAFDDPEWGATTAGQAIDQGADVVFAAGGKTGNGGLQEVAQRVTEETQLFCIGVDTDQWFTVPEAHPCLVTSAMKLIDQGVVELVQMIADETIEGGNYVGDVGLADYHDFADVVPQEVQDEITELKAMLESGELLPDGTTPEATPEATMEATAGN
jgi:basic membrane protein A and related proteins